MSSSNDTSEELLTHLEDGVLVVKFNRPARMNAVTPSLTRRYMEAMLAASTDTKVRVIVVTGAGRAFCAGADMAVLGEREKGVPREAKLRPHRFVTDIPKPVIAAINGACVGVGFVKAMMCDFRFVAQSAKVGPGFARLGLAAEHGVAWVMAQSAGYARAFEAFSSSQFFQGEDLVRLGIANKVLPDDALMEHTMKFARDLALNCSPRSLAVIKMQLRHALQSDLAASDALADELTGLAFGTSDFKEALSARKEKRAPQFAPFDPQQPGWWPQAANDAGRQ